MTTDSNDREKRGWFDGRHTVDNIYRALWLICALLFVADLLYDKHATFEIEALFGFYGWFAVVSGLLLVFGARLLRKVLMRPEDYYDR